jgi:formylglycine-generating enzyme required for sulfatase activity
MRAFNSTKPMTKRLYLLIAASISMCGLLLAAVLVPMGSDAAVQPALVTREPAPAPAGMVWVPGGTFTMGSDVYLSAGDPNPDRIKADETPAHVVELDGFWMDATPVTNRQFQEFVEQTGYVTFAERQLTKADFASRGADTTAFPSGIINPGSMCFNPKFDRQQLVMEGPGWEHQVWMIVDGADWRHPDGPQSTIDGKLDHPVVHVAWEDAQAYCKWAGKRLPTEAEFEYAAKDGGKPIKYPWGNELAPSGALMANYWQGEFPLVRQNEDGFLTTSPVKSFPPNSLGLYDMAGNVWEWCQDLYHADYYSVSPRKNPKGPDTSFDPQMPGTLKRVQRGGSFLCNFNNCTGYRTCSRGRGDVASSSYHNGFRCVLDPTMLSEFKTAQ